MSEEIFESQNSYVKLQIFIKVFLSFGVHFTEKPSFSKLLESFYS